MERNGCDVQILSIVLSLFMRHILYATIKSLEKSPSLSLKNRISSLMMEMNDEARLVDALGYIVGTIINVTLVDSLFESHLNKLYNLKEEGVSKEGCTQQSNIRDTVKLVVFISVKTLVVILWNLRKGENNSFIDALRKASGQLLQNVGLSVASLLMFNVVFRPLINNWLKDDTVLRDRIMVGLKTIITFVIGDYLPDRTLLGGNKNDDGGGLLGLGASGVTAVAAAVLSSTPGVGLSDRDFLR